MTIGQYSEFYRGKRVVDFSVDQPASGGDVVYRLRQEYEGEDTQAALLDSLLAQVDPASIQALIIGAWRESHDEGPNGYLQRLIERRDELPALRALFVGDMTYEDCEISWIIQTDYTPLLAAFPALESLRIRGSSQLQLTPFAHAQLQELAIECGGLPSAIVQAIAASTLPALRHLELWLGVEDYGFDGDLGTYQRLLAAIGPERLRYLGLRNAANTDELASWLATQPWLGRLETLDLSLGTIGDAGARALVESTQLGQLQRIDLSHHYISAEWQARLATLPVTVILDEPLEEDEDERYVAVSE
ncbi:STM4015 family protein [Xanthomonas axonopodis pv. poinsettiicola]|uniref:STM4015 family protein n=1 Tax=Xanthomonas TaxID=338 RepID=UPI001E44E182|nr:STM4015 family protein [Xanthomonas codiaei]MCC8537719.1 STM4015 family protein [Xanthomonas codiaei]